MAPQGKIHFYSEFQLLGCIEMEHNIFAMPLQKDTEVIPIPDKSKLKFVTAKNINQLEKLSEYFRLLKKARKHVDEYMTKSLQSVFKNRQDGKKGNSSNMNLGDVENNNEKSRC